MEGRKKSLNLRRLELGKKEWQWLAGSPFFLPSFFHRSHDLWPKKEEGGRIAWCQTELPPVISSNLSSRFSSLRGFFIIFRGHFENRTSTGRRRPRKNPLRPRLEHESCKLWYEKFISIFRGRNYISALSPHLFCY